MKPANDELDWWESAREHGCIINNTDCGGGLQLHHITDGGRRMGHHYTLPICKNHHHWDSPLATGDAFGKGSKPWVNKHGNQLELWKSLRESLGFSTLENEDD